MLIIKNARIVTPDGIIQSGLVIDGGKITGYADDVSGFCEVYDAGGKYVLPGLIDAHTHFEMDLGVTVTADSFKTGTAAAVCGGTTTILDFATQERGGTLSDALDVWHGRAGGSCSCDYGFHMAVTDISGAAMDELPEMFKRGVTIFKAYMAYDNLKLADAEIACLL